MKQKTKIKIPKNCESFTLEFNFEEEDSPKIISPEPIISGEYYKIFTDGYYFFVRASQDDLDNKNIEKKVLGYSYHPDLYPHSFYESKITYSYTDRTYQKASPEEIQEFKDKELESKFSKNVWYYYENRLCKWLFKLDRIENGNFYHKDLMASDNKPSGSMFSCVDNIAKATQQQIDLFLKPKLEFKENEVWKAKFIDSDVIFIFVVDKVKDQSVIAKMYATDKVLYTEGSFSINNCKFEKSTEAELQKVLYSRNKKYNFKTDSLEGCRKFRENYWYLSTRGNVERRIDMGDPEGHSHLHCGNYFYSYEEIKKYKEALKRFNTLWHENN